MIHCVSSLTCNSAAMQAFLACEGKASREIWVPVLSQRVLHPLQNGGISFGSCCNVPLWFTHVLCICFIVHSGKVFSLFFVTVASIERFYPKLKCCCVEINDLSWVFEILTSHFSWKMQYLKTLSLGLLCFFFN